MPYLSTTEYLARFGERETILLTDDSRVGEVDTAKLEAALENATEEAEAYIGKRYDIPLSSPPNLVKSIVGALTRESLYQSNRPESVVDDARVARSQLKDIARGLIAIPGEAAVLAESSSSRPSSATSGDGVTPIFTERTLAGFSVGSGYPVPNWRR